MCEWCLLLSTPSLGTSSKKALLKKLAAFILQQQSWVTVLTLWSENQTSLVSDYILFSLLLWSHWEDRTPFRTCWWCGVPKKCSFKVIGCDITLQFTTYLSKKWSFENTGRKTRRCFPFFLSSPKFISQRPITNEFCTGEFLIFEAPRAETILAEI